MRLLPEPVGRRRAGRTSADEEEREGRWRERGTHAGSTLRPPTRRTGKSLSGVSVRRSKTGTIWSASAARVVVSDASARVDLERGSTRRTSALKLQDRGRRPCAQGEQFVLQVPRPPARAGPQKQLSAGIGAFVGWHKRAERGEGKTYGSPWPLPRTTTGRSRQTCSTISSMSSASATEWSGSKSSTSSGAWPEGGGGGRQSGRRGKGTRRGGRGRTGVDLGAVGHRRDRVRVLACQKLRIVRGRRVS